MTMTTVGYGDAYPITGAGMFVASVTMVVGLLCIAFPVTIITANLTAVKEEVEERKKLRKRQRERIEAAHLKAGNSSEALLGALDPDIAFARMERAQLTMVEQLAAMKEAVAKFEDAATAADLALTAWRAARHASTRTVPPSPNASFRQE